MGSLRSHLVRLFLTESILLSLGAFAIALLFSWLLLPTFNQLASKELSIPVNLFYFMPIAALALGIFAGLYPAFVLSSVSLAKNTSRGARSLMRNSLVVFQFTVSILLIVGNDNGESSARLYSGYKNRLRQVAGDHRKRWLRIEA